MKKTKIFYWIVTSLFAAFMLFSAIFDILIVPEAKVIFAHLGYPEYFIPFIGWAKLLGVIGILVPGFPRIKEWAYAGLAFDLIGATYSVIAVEGFQLPTLTMILPFTFLFLSYTLYHKISRAEHKIALA